MQTPQDIGTGEGVFPHYSSVLLPGLSVCKVGTTSVSRPAPLARIFLTVVPDVNLKDSWPMEVDEVGWSAPDIDPLKVPLMIFKQCIIDPMTVP